MSESPDKVYAKCPVCGSGGDLSVSNLTGADSQSNIDTTPTGDYLVWHEGELMCPLCKQNRINRRESEAASERHAAEEDFRAGAGFKRTI